MSTFSEIINDKLVTVNAGALGAFMMAPFEKNPDIILQDLSDSLWLTENGLKLEQKFKNGRNQCYACYLFEQTFGLPELDSLIEL
ncbi:hypothetical protein Dehly_0122 [Dehalogenimonas lykanthroporepellens BL-DC-9]|nr:hypothetical protein Dehly_0122 [Dehalogenimonas lykanthroporepellens BL-DC-9]